MSKIILRSIFSTVILLIFTLHLQGCAVVAVTGAVAGAVVVTTVKVGAAAVGTAVDVTRAGVRVVIP
jgi:uncharacterized MnhB-related membrane protein